MRNKLTILGCIISVFINHIFSQCTYEQKNLTSVSPCNSTWFLKFEDNFTYGTLDQNKWGYVYPWMQSDGLAFYTYNNLNLVNYSSNFINDAYGVLQLISKTESVSGYNFTSGMIISKDLFGFGKYEIRCKIPEGKGHWPAFWIFGQDSQTWQEVDFFEFWGNTNEGENDNVHMNVHYNPNNQTTTGKVDCSDIWNDGRDFSKSFHIYTVIYDRTETKWYIDGQLVRYLTRWSNLLNQQVPCQSLITPQIYNINKAFPIGGLSNIIINSKVEYSNADVPNKFEIDYIRYYSHDPCPVSGTVNTTLPCQDILSQKGFYINNKLDLVTEVCPQNDIIIKAIPLDPSVCSNGYFLLSSNKQLFISVTLCNDNLVPIDVEYSNWIEPGSATSFNLMANYSVFGVTIYPNLPSPYITFNPGQTYRIKVATSRCGWQEYTKYIHIASDVRNINGSNIVSDVYGKYITISNSSVTQPKEIVAKEYIKILPNSTLYAGTYRINDFGCADMAGREMDSTNEEVLRMNYMVDENVLYNEEFTDVELNKKTIDEANETPQSNSNFAIYPNPNKGQFTIELNNTATESTIEIYDLMGKKVWSKISLENKLEIDISNQPKGIYLVKVVNENQVKVQKIIYD